MTPLWMILALNPFWICRTFPLIRASFPDLTSLWHKSARRMFTAGPIGSDGILDWKGSSETYSYSNVLRARSMEFSFDVGRDLSLNRSRFTTLQRSYLHPDDLDSFLARVEKIGRKTASRGVLTTMAVRQKEGSRGRYANGPCIIGYGWRGGHRGPPPTLTLHSRTSYLTYMGGMDLALCYVLASNIGETLDIAVEDIQFEWFSDALMSHNYKQLPYVMVHGQEFMTNEKRWPSDNHPTLKLGRREWNIMLDRIDTPLADEKWGARRRVWRRYREYLEGGGPPNCPVQSLTFDKLYDHKKRGKGWIPWTEEERLALVTAIKRQCRKVGDCLEYTGQEKRPYRSHRGRLYPLARLVLSLYDGGFDYDDPYLWALHNCDNKMCVKPSHLYAGTPSDNIHDAVERGGLNVGENNGQAILTEDLAIIIRDAQGAQREIAQTYGISQSAVSLIQNGRRWRHL